MFDLNIYNLKNKKTKNLTKQPKLWQQWLSAPITQQMLGNTGLENKTCFLLIPSLSLVWCVLDIYCITDVNATAGSYRDDIQLPENVEQEETGDGKRKASSEDEKEEEEKANSVTKKRRLRSRSMCDDEVGPDSSSSQMTPGRRKKNKKIHFCKSPSTSALVL